jgi:hypothetical protein
MPKASMADAMVLAVYICNQLDRYDYNSLLRKHQIRGMHFESSRNESFPPPRSVPLASIDRNSGKQRRYRAAPRVVRSFRLHIFLA